MKLQDVEQTRQKDVTQDEAYKMEEKTEQWLHTERTEDSLGTRGYTPEKQKRK
jgi:hypothetical protein